MADAVELAVAYVQLVPSLQGSQGAIAEALIPEIAKSGDEAGKGWGDKFKSAIGGIDYKMIGLGAAGALAAGFSGLVAVGGIFDDLSDTIRTGTGASGEALDGLVDVAKSVGSNVPAEFSKIGPTVADLNTRLGLSGDTLETVASQYLEAGRILGEDVDIRKTSAAFSAFGIEGAAVEDAMDSLFRVSQSTGVGMNELGAIVSKNGAAMQGLGFDFGETAALAGVLDKAGLDANRTMGSMGRALVNLAKDGEEPQDAFKRVTGEISSLVAKGDEAKALDLAAQLFGTKGAPQMLQALKDGTLSAESLSDALVGSGDTILGVGEDTADFAESWQVLKNNAALALEPLASTVFTSLSDTLSGMMPALTQFGSWLSENQWVLGVVAGIIGGVMVASFAAWAASVWVANAALLANPITWIVLGIVALIAALALLVANWETVAAFLSGVWSGIVEAVTGWWDGLVAGFGEGMAEIGASLSAGWAEIVAGITEWWSGVVEFFAGVWSAIVAGVVGFVVGVGTWFAGLWSGIVAGVTGFGASVIAFLAGVWSAIVAGIVGLVTTAINFYVGLWSTIIGGAIAFGSSILSFLAGVWSGIVAAVAGFVGNIVARLAGAWSNIMSTVTGFGGRILSFLAGVWSGLNQAAQATWNIIVGFITGQPGRIFAGLASLGQLASKALAWFGGMLSSAQAKLGELVSFVGGIPGRIVSALGNIGGMLINSGRALLDGLAQGIREGVGRAISAAKNGLQSIRNLFPFSPARDPRSPFYGSGYTDRSGLALISDFAGGVLKGAPEARKDVADALDGVAVSMLPAQPITARASVGVDPAERGGDTWHVELRADDLEGLRTIEEFILTAERKKRAGTGGR